MAIAREAPAACRQVTTGAVASPVQAVKDLLHACAVHRLVIVGEVHGSNEVPALVGALVEQAAEERPVRLGLEMPSAMQATLDSYLRSSGGADDRANLLRASFWKGRDGRSSKAMLQLIDRVRALRAQGTDVDVFAMVPDYPDEQTIKAAGGFALFDDTGMAEHIRHELDGLAPDGLVIAYMGNYHSRYAPPTPGAVGPSVTGQLVASSPFVLTPVAAHLESWNCTQDGCGVHAYDPRSTPSERLPRLVVELAATRGPFVATLWLERTTASRPATESL
ncbi:hypothetical protein ACFWZ3_05105 [Frateuria sp. GZRR35]|uniref:hypothetical protein n=1 Tax=Frateuria sp. GZRR35 TaxID=3351536 RepID=UPI003EDB6D3E